MNLRAHAPLPQRRTDPAVIYKYSMKFVDIQTLVESFQFMCLRRSH